MMAPPLDCSFWIMTKLWPPPTIEHHLRAMCFPLIQVYFILYAVQSGIIKSLGDLFLCIHTRTGVFGCLNRKIERKYPRTDREKIHQTNQSESK